MLTIMIEDIVTAHLFELFKQRVRYPLKPIMPWILRSRLNGREILKLVPTHVRRECTLVEGASPQEKGENLTLRMKEDGII